MSFGSKLKKKIILSGIVILEHLGFDIDINMFTGGCADVCNHLRNSLIYKFHRKFFISYLDYYKRSDWDLSTIVKWYFGKDVLERENYRAKELLEQVLKIVELFQGRKDNKLR